MNITMRCVNGSSGLCSFSARSHSVFSGLCVMNYEPIGKRTFWPCKYTLGLLVFMRDFFKSASLPLALFEDVGLDYARLKLRPQMFQCVMLILLGALHKHV
jgi:hypothetical protein